jgi:microcystin-dependent protein
MDPILGSIILFTGNFAPQGWMTCEGQTISIMQNQALYSIIGTTYGGDGIQTFKLPDLRGAFPTQCTNLGGPHMGGNYTFGQMGGSQNTTITSVNMPPHTHSIVKGPGTNLTGAVSVTTTIGASNVSTGATETPANGNVLSAVNDLGGSGGVGIYSTNATNVTLGGANTTTNSTLNFDPTGLTLTPWGSGPVPIPTVPPFVAMQFIIAVEGIYPSRP